MAQYPGEIVEGAVRGITGAAKGVVSSIANGVSNVGEQVQQAVDTPFKGAGLRASPLRIIDAPLKGVVAAGANFVNSGVIGGFETVIGGLADGVDEIPKTLVSIGQRDRMPKLPWERR